jgi:hypothetical protein
MMEKDLAEDLRRAGCTAVRRIKSGETVLGNYSIATVNIGTGHMERLEQ